MDEHGFQLRRIVRACPWLMEALGAVRATIPGAAYIGAGAVRAAVWDALHGLPPSPPPGDIDVVYFDGADTTPGRDDVLQTALRAACPGFAWEVTNQAAVHHWYGHHFGRQIAPFGSLGEAIATWPETATAVAVRLLDDDAIDIIAPLGLADLMAMTVRWNPALATRAQYEERVAGKDYRRRWPGVRILPA